MNEETTSPHCPSTSAHGDVCTLTRGHEGPGHERHVAGERVASWIDPAEPARRCDATIKNGFDETVRCGLEFGHTLERGGEWPGSPGAYDHMGQTATGHPLWWRDTAADCTPSSAPAQVPDTVKLTINDQRRAAGLPSWEMRTVDDPRPVRVRFIDLPPRYEQRAVLAGIRVTATVAVPGGFALVVDRFKDRSDCAAQRPRWDDFGATIGAHVVVCYPGELDIASWMDAS